MIGAAEEKAKCDNTNIMENVVEATKKIIYLSLRICICSMYMFMYLSLSLYLSIYIYIYMYTEREREREREREVCLSLSLSLALLFRVPLRFLLPPALPPPPDLDRLATVSYLGMPEAGSRMLRTGTRSCCPLGLGGTKRRTFG